MDIILYANSITLNEQLISSARVYGEVKIHEKISIEQLNALSNCSYGFVHQGTLHFNVDVCEGFCDKINSLSEAFEFIPIWTRVPLLLFLNSTEAQRFLENMQTKAYEEITKEKILKSKPEVSKIIYGQ